MHSPAGAWECILTCGYCTPIVQYPNWDNSHLEHILMFFELFALRQKKF